MHVKITISQGSEKWWSGWTGGRPCQVVVSSGFTVNKIFQLNINQYVRKKKHLCIIKTRRDNHAFYYFEPFWGVLGFLVTTRNW